MSKERQDEWLAVRASAFDQDPDLSYTKGLENELLELQVVKERARLDHCLMAIAKNVVTDRRLRRLSRANRKTANTRFINERGVPRSRACPVSRSARHCGICCQDLMHRHSEQVRLQ